MSRKSLKDVSSVSRKCLKSVSKGSQKCLKSVSEAYRGSRKYLGPPRRRTSPRAARAFQSPPRPPKIDSVHHGARLVRYFANRRPSRLQRRRQPALARRSVDALLEALRGTRQLLQQVRRPPDHNEPTAHVVICERTRRASATPARRRPSAATASGSHRRRASRAIRAEAGRG